MDMQLLSTLLLFSRSFFLCALRSHAATIASSITKTKYYDHVISKGTNSKQAEDRGLYQKCTMSRPQTRNIVLCSVCEAQYSWAIVSIHLLFIHNGSVSNIEASNS